MPHIILTQINTSGTSLEFAPISISLPLQNYWLRLRVSYPQSTAGVIIWGLGLLSYADRRQLRLEDLMTQVPANTWQLGDDVLIRFDTSGYFVLAHDTYEERRAFYQMRNTQIAAEG